jgi:tRNA A-37 threonylcarbamoyl transferase component Bud32
MDSGEQFRLEDGRILTCIETVRMLPGKRQVFLGDIDGVPVFAKLYLDSGRRQKHWQRELDGINVFLQRGILTAQLLYAGEAGENGNPLILLARLPEPVSLKFAWEGADSTEQLQLLRDMVAVLAGHHNAGVCQSDLHLDNFVISEGQIYSLDGAGVGAIDGALDINAGLDNLALFLAQLLPQWMDFVPELYALYLKKREMEDGPGDQYLLRQTKQLREWRWDKFRSKLFRDCTAIRYRETAQRLEIVARNYVGAELDPLLNDPDTSFPGRENALKNGTTCTVWAAQAGSLPVVIKRYNSRGWFKGLLQKIVPGRALVSWESAHLLNFYGILTPRPIAMLQIKGNNSTSYFIAEKIEGICLYYWLLDDSRSEADLEMMAKKVVGVFVQLYSHCITHGDLKIANWFVADGEVALIDLDSMKKRRDSLRFRWIWRSDIRRFMRNWKDLPKLHDLFSGEFEKQGLEWK